MFKCTSITSLVVPAISETIATSLLDKLFNKYERIHLMDRSLIIGAIIIIFTQLFDVQYYDFRISCLLWLFMSSLKCIIDDQDFYKKQSYQGAPFPKDQ